MDQSRCIVSRSEGVSISEIPSVAYIVVNVHRISVHVATND